MQFIEDIQGALEQLTNKKLNHIKSKGCYFTNSLDENYITDRVSDGNWVIAGLSGHGFKFIPALAARLIDGIKMEKLPDDLNIFSISRFKTMPSSVSRTHIKDSDLMLVRTWQL